MYTCAYILLTAGLAQSAGARLLFDELLHPLLLSLTRFLSFSLQHVYELSPIRLENLMGFRMPVVYIGFFSLRLHTFYIEKSGH